MHIEITVKTIQIQDFERNCAFESPINELEIYLIVTPVYRDAIFISSSLLTREDEQRPPRWPG
jgi:hypothetical protein